MSSKKNVTPVITPNIPALVQGLADENKALKEEIVRLNEICLGGNTIIETTLHLIDRLDSYKNLGEVLKRNAQLEASIEKIHSSMRMAGVQFPFAPEQKLYDLYWILLDELAEDVAKLRKVGGSNVQSK